MRKKPNIEPKAGETLVEVIVSVFLFLLVLSILQGAVAYSSSVLRKNKELRAEQGQILEGLSGGAARENGQIVLTFQAVNAAMTQTGNEVFSVSLPLGVQPVSYKNSAGETKTVNFYLYLPKAEGGERP